MRTFIAHDRNRVQRVRFTPNAQTLTVAVRGVHLLSHFHPATGDCSAWQPGGYEYPRDLIYSAGGGFVAVASGASVRTFRRGVVATNGRPALDPITVHRVESANGSLALAFSPTTDPRATRLAVASNELLVWNPHTQEYIVAPDEGDYRGVSFGPDGNTVASIEYHTHSLCVWNVKPFRVLFRTDLKGINTFDNGLVAMLPDGERVIVAAGSLLRCVPINGGTSWDTVTKKPPLEIALHPSGRMLLVADGSKKVTAYDTDNGKASAQYDWGIGKVGCVTYSPDGTLAAAGGEKGQVVVWDAE